MSPYRTILARCPICREIMYKKTVISNAPTACGDPRITCPHCGRETTDDNVLELALRPRAWYDENYARPAVYITLLFMPWVLLLAFGLIGMQFKAVRELPAFVLVTIVLSIVVLGHIPGIRYMVKRCDVKPTSDHFEHDYWESEQRLRDPAYRQFLLADGYLQRHHIENIW